MIDGLAQDSSGLTLNFKLISMIQRDGSSVSLWQDSQGAFQSSHFGSTETVYDVIIVGGGITGLSTALLLQESGKNCLLLEAANLGFGTTSGTTAHLNTLLDTPYTQIEKNFSEEKSRQVADAAAAALNLVKRNVEKYSIECGLQEADAWLFSADDKEDKELSEIAEAARRAGLDLVFTTELPIRVPFKRAIRVAGQGKFNPIDYIYGLAKAFEQAGGIIMQHCRVANVQQKENVQADTSKGVFKGVDLVYATHVPPGINLLHLRCAPWRSYAMAVKLADENYPEGLIYDMKDPYFYYRTQVVQGQPYLIAGGVDHKTGEEEYSERSFEELEAHVRKYFEIEEVAYRWSSQYFEPTDGLPYIGRLPGHAEHVYVATGFGGNGMTYSAVSALTLKAMILGEESPYISLFDPNRLKPVAGFTNFIAHNVDVVKNFAGRLFSAEKLGELAGLAEGEGKVVKYEGEKIGIYKDEQGGIHAIDPVCTHMKCEVKWNAAELSWDCPCHGARYSVDGKVLTGPADRDLEKITIESLVQK